MTGHLIRFAQSSLRAAAGAAFSIALTATAALAAPAVTPLVSTDWLAGHTGASDVVILDIRSKMSKSGKEDYLKGHIPGAVWSEYPGYWRTDRDGVTGMLPAVEKLEAVLSEVGLSEDKALVIVPGGFNSSDFSAAARVYWTLKYLGHDAVAILDGGFAAWAEENRPLQTGDVTPIGDLFVAEPDEALLVSTNEVAELLGTGTLLLDGRPANQFAGAQKHSDATRFGHIPGAVNLDQDQFYDRKTNRLKSKSELARLLPASVQGSNGKIVSYCNTGHWAAANWFILTQVLGRDNVTLYDASMVGWSQDKSLPIEATVAPAEPAKAK
ncbi:sulfurtransferase [Roseibium suaedae]|uniref:Thiosulfate/3-mercaptopyruvate sulfurtransferase n=1 Tax=Roseibium suaedae TaxID=735517 RepID=A0A1M7CNQ7_9HYPH|nr:rhodanese-like domain-containing protein [Roseibium suaedae]SHL68938.1 thiosulfate/3-mercaptopyruvate sulfurtransferase [Roseibium suaedae]